MKDNSLLLCFSVLAFLAGCTEVCETALPEESKPVQEETQTETGFRAVMPGGQKTIVDFVSGEGIVKWLTDDPVFITNGTQSSTYYIKQGGTTSSPLYTKGKALDGEAFYAVYPSTGADYDGTVFTASIPTSQTYAENGFGTKTFPMVAVCGEDRILNFKNAASLLKITPTADWTGKISQVVVSAEKPLAGDITVSYQGGLTVPEVTCTGSKSVTVNCGDVEMGQPIYVVIAPGSYDQMQVSVSMASGLTVKVPQSDVVKVDRSKFASLSFNLSSQFKDLSEKGTANCYLLKEPGAYRFKASVRGNGVETSCGITSKNENVAGVSEYFSDGAKFISGGYSYMDGYIYFSTVEGESLPIGTSLINLKNNLGQTIWSWHIWANPDVKDIELGGNTWMNMNLGAHSATWNDEGYMGYYYQWGRKDPMMQKYGAAGDFKNPWASHASLIDGSIENSILNPTYFYGSYYHSSDPSTTISDWSFYSADMSLVVWDWWCKDLTESTTTGTVKKTMWDPCPVGYHVPEADAFAALDKTKITWEDFDATNHSHKCGTFLVPTLSHRGVGVGAQNWKGATADTPAYLWTAFPGTATGKGKVNAQRAWFRNKTAGFTETVRAYGVPVRCISDK